MKSDNNIKDSVRLTYLQLSKDDSEMSIKMSQDEIVMKYITGRRLSDAEALKRFEEQMAINSQNKSLGFIKALNKVNHENIGYLKMVRIEPGVLEVGYAILPEHWGKGYATEMLKSMIIHALNFKQFHQILGIIDVDNPASKKVLLKQGFTFQKEFIQKGKKSAHFIKNNT